MVSLRRSFAESAYFTLLQCGAVAHDHLCVVLFGCLDLGFVPVIRASIGALLSLQVPVGGLFGGLHAV